MRKAATFRLDAELLANARRHAREDNRSLTNLVETLLKTCVGETAKPIGAEQAPAGRRGDGASA